MDIQFVKIDKKILEDNIIFIQVGNNDYPATDEDVQNIESCFNQLVKYLKIDIYPCILVTHHAIDFSSCPLKELQRIKTKIDDKIKKIENKDKEIL